MSANIVDILCILAFEGRNITILPFFHACCVVLEGFIASPHYFNGSVGGLSLFDTSLNQVWWEHVSGKKIVEKSLNFCHFQVINVDI